MAVSPTRHQLLFPSTQAMVAYRGFADYPEHTRVTLPALSPTMEFGTVTTWEKKEGDYVNEGDLLCEIETDKATMGFETPEPGYVAKVFVEAGTKDIPIGKLLAIIVESEEEVAKFKDFEDDGSSLVGAKPQAPKEEKAAPAPPRKTATWKIRDVSEEPLQTDEGWRCPFEVRDKTDFIYTQYDAYGTICAYFLDIFVVPCEVMLQVNPFGGFEVAPFACQFHLLRCFFNSQLYGVLYLQLSQARDFSLFIFS